MYLNRRAFVMMSECTFSDVAASPEYFVLLQELTPIRTEKCHFLKALSSLTVYSFILISFYFKRLNNTGHDSIDHTQIHEPLSVRVHTSQAFGTGKCICGPYFFFLLNILQ